MKLLKRTKDNISLLWIVLCVISTISILVYNGSKDNNNLFIVKSTIFSIILISILIFFILEKKIKGMDFPYFTLIIIGAYLFSLLLIISTKGNVGFHIWLLGSIIISALININLGFIILFHHAFLVSMFGNYETEQVIYLLLFGIVLCILSKHMKERNLLKYIIIIVVSLDFILQFIINDFLINNMIKNDVINTIITNVIIVFITYIISNIYKNKVIQRTKTYQIEELVISTLDGQAGTSVNNKDNINDNTNIISMTKDEINTELKNTELKNTELIDTELINTIINTDFILLQELRKYSINLYERSLKVGNISLLAAKEIGADEKLTQAGGLYHDIGRMREGDYVEEGLKIANQYNMPSKIGDIIYQHNIKYDTPKSPEAAIVMLTVSVIATIDILENSEKLQGNAYKSMSIMKIVENVFDMRLSRHSLDDSGLTIHQFHKLKAFYTTQVIELLKVY